MTIVTSTRPATRSGPPTWARLAGWQFTGYWWLFGGYLITAIIAVTLILTLVSRQTEPTMSGITVAQQAAVWFAFGTAVYFATSWLGPMVSAGATRRTIEKAGILAITGLGITGSIAWMLAGRIEAWAFGRLGWTHGVDEGRVSAADAPVLSYVAGLALIIIIAGLCGSIVGLTYFRWGSWATALLPVTLLPLIACAVFGVDPATVFPPFIAELTDALRPGEGAPGTGMRVLLGLVVLALTALAHHLLIRRVPVRSAKA